MSNHENEKINEAIMEGHIMTKEYWESMNYERKVQYSSTLGFKTVKDFERFLYNEKQ